MSKIILIVVSIWLLLTALVLVFMYAVGELNDRYDRKEDRYNENYSEGDK